MNLNKFLAYVSGTLMSLNFIAFWGIPIFSMGSLYKSLLKPYLQPIYLYLEANLYVRRFAHTFFYTKEQHADFFAMSALLILNCSISIPTVFFWQLKYGHLPWWLIGLYYCSWVGIGGSMMGAAYGLAHKEVFHLSFFFLFLLLFHLKI